ncbi:MAG: hypothetical protein M1822_004330 [Bathelium mastoideum]|nr:MAG: hypothetical protein M1822_004330 [Bathelium mastoideum]
MSEDTRILDSANPRAIPVLLLKTKSSPTDEYQEYFSNLTNEPYLPEFIPVLEHRLKDEALSYLSELIRSSRAFGLVGLHGSDEGSASRYGGIIFTSQRAVEAFARVIEKLRKLSLPLDLLLPDGLPLYVVGPATTRALTALGLSCSILGENSGNGEALANFILEHYNKNMKCMTRENGTNLPLLFLVGEQRRDIIPKTLQAESLKSSDRIPVHELVVYESAEMSTFRSDFLKTWEKCQRFPQTWVVVFSPTGCRAMLECLGMLDKASGRIKDNMIRGDRPAIATIGPTTRDFLIREFGFQPEVCAGKPSPEGIAEGIALFMQSDAALKFRRP